ncbi:MAG: gamma carbonic anhydrase family protein [Acetatifactor sp.]|nr:gamma carbonic anhydrase family protein [Acetatifactor sp.]
MAWEGVEKCGRVGAEEGAVYISPSSSLSGDITLAEDTSVWHHATLRADDGPIRIGRGSNVQDNAVLHMDPGGEVELGEYVTVGHGAIVHGCKVGDNTLIGMGAILMNHARIGCNCIIGAGTLVTQGMEIPDNSLVVGSPGRIKRQVTEEEIRTSRSNAEHYVKKAKALKAEQE